MNDAVGIDIGGTKVLSAVVSESGEVKDSVEVKSDVTDAESLFQSMVTSVEMLLKQSGISKEKVAGIGVGVPGFVDRENGIALYQSNIPWENFDVGSRLSEVFGILLWITMLRWQVIMHMKQSVTKEKWSPILPSAQDWHAQ